MGWARCQITVREHQFRGWIRHTSKNVLFTINPFTTLISIGDEVSHGNDIYTVLETVNIGGRSETLDLIAFRKDDKHDPENEGNKKRDNKRAQSNARRGGNNPRRK